MKVRITRGQVWIVFGVCTLLSIAACAYYLGRGFEPLFKDRGGAYFIGTLTAIVPFWMLFLILMCRNGALYGQKGDRQSTIVLWFCLMGFAAMASLGVWAGMNELLLQFTDELDTAAIWAVLGTMLIFGTPFGLWFNYFYPTQTAKTCQCHA